MKLTGRENPELAKELLHIIDFIRVLPQDRWISLWLDGCKMDGNCSYVHPPSSIISPRIPWSYNIAFLKKTGRWPLPLLLAFNQVATPADFGWSWSRSMGEKELEAFNFMHDLFMQIKLLEWHDQRMFLCSFFCLGLPWFDIREQQLFACFIWSEFCLKSTSLNRNGYMLVGKNFGGNFKWALGKDQHLEVTRGSNLREVFSPLPEGQYFWRSKGCLPISTRKERIAVQLYSNICPFALSMLTQVRQWDH